MPRAAGNCMRWLKALIPLSRRLVVKLLFLFCYSYAHDRLGGHQEENRVVSKSLKMLV